MSEIFIGEHQTLMNEKLILNNKKRKKKNKYRHSFANLHYRSC